MSEIKIYKDGCSDEPKFSEDFEVTEKAVLQVTDIKTNRNKYYAIELHSTLSMFRVYTHYGRTDDLESNPNAGVRESRYCTSLSEAKSLYDKIYKEKTSARKGYKELSLASSKIGSKKSYGKSSGSIDDKTLQKLAEKTQPQTKSTITLEKPVQELVSKIYERATKALTSVVNATITANGIETPLGVLTIGQIDKGQSILDDLQIAVLKKNSKDELIQLSGDFYTLIPHKFGRTKIAAEQAVINDQTKVSEKQETLQLMRDMLNVNGSSNVLINPEIEKKYQALNCAIETVSADKFKEIKSYIEKSIIRGYRMKIKQIFSIRRQLEIDAFQSKIGNEKLLFHGSSAKNWVGILSRGLLLPKIVVKMGVTRTDAGWLGHGIYFGNAACTAYNYSGASYGGSFIALASVALGKMKEYKKITYGLTEPPAGYNSCHGVRGSGSQFADDEFVIYSHDQQHLQYLVEVE